MSHTQSAGGVVLGPHGQVLVVNQRGLSWSLPKGHIEDQEDTLDAAKREIFEETGVEESRLTLIGPLGSYGRYRIGKEGSEDPSEYKTITMFLFKTTKIDLMPQDPDNPEARWISKEQVCDLLTHAADKAFFAGVLQSL